MEGVSSINSCDGGGESCGGWQPAARHSSDEKRAAATAELAITRPAQCHRKREANDSSTEDDGDENAQLPDDDDDDRQQEGFVVGRRRWCAPDCTTGRVALVRRAARAGVVLALRSPSAPSGGKWRACGPGLWRFGAALAPHVTLFSFTLPLPYSS